MNNSNTISLNHRMDSIPAAETREIQMPTLCTSNLSNQSFNQQCTWNYQQSQHTLESSTITNSSTFTATHPSCMSSYHHTFSSLPSIIHILRFCDFYNDQ